MTSKFNVRIASLDDAPRLAVLAAQVWTHTYATDGISQDIAEFVLCELNSDRYRHAIDDSSTLVLVAECGVYLVGFAVVKFGSACTVEGVSDTELKTLYVQELFTGQGVGRLLLQAAQTQSRERASGAMWLSVNATNHRAMSFYTRLGYRKIGTSYFVLGVAQHENHVLVGASVVV